MANEGEVEDGEAFNKMSEAFNKGIDCNVAGLSSAAMSKSRPGFLASKGKVNKVKPGANTPNTGDNQQGGNNNGHANKAPPATYREQAESLVSGLLKDAAYARMDGLQLQDLEICNETAARLIAIGSDLETDHTTLRRELKDAGLEDEHFWGWVEHLKGKTTQLEEDRQMAKAPLKTNRN